MNLSENQALILFQMEQVARVTVNGVKTTHQKNEERINDFKKIKETTLFEIKNLSIVARYVNNDAPYTIVGLKVLATPWTNGKKDQDIDCKIKIKIEFIFSKINYDHKWESSVYSISGTRSLLAFSNEHGFEKNLIIESLSKFDELTKIIKEAIEAIGLSYPIK